MKLERRRPSVFLTRASLDGVRCTGVALTEQRARELARCVVTQGLTPCWVELTKMVRVGLVIATVTLASCAPCPRPVFGLGAPRVEDQERGVPKVLVEASATLLDESQVRRCQVLFEPAFSNAHAVWFVQDDTAVDAMVVVRVRLDDRIQSYSAPLDHGTGLRLSKLCLASLTSRTEGCGRRGMDGVWYHVAHPQTAHSYAMASFWSPRQGTVASDFVRVAEALRNYATVPATLRSPAWLALQEAANSLSTRLASSG
jgi:hypothetical protein